LKHRAEHGYYYGPAAFSRLGRPKNGGRRERIGLLNIINNLTAPSPVFQRAVALFLDVDGTLLDFARRPDAVEPSAGLTDILRRLEFKLGGALALISGRAVDDLDRIFDPLRLPTGGQHGLERRDAEGALHVADVAHALEGIRPQLRDFVDRHEGALLEDKGAALALHYRMAPAAEAAARTLVESLTANRDELHYLAGKMVFEIKPCAVDKGVAIASFMAEAPFSGRMPVFLGDDVTDEDGFRFVNQTGGLSVRVGQSQDSAARFALPDVPAVLDWLQIVAKHLDGNTG